MSKENGNVISIKLLSNNKYAITRNGKIVKVFDPDAIAAATAFALTLTKGKPQNQSVARHEAYVAKIAEEEKRAKLIAKRAEQERLSKERSERALLDMAPSADTLVTEEMIAQAIKFCDDPWHDNSERVKFRKKLEALVGSELGGIKWHGNDTIVVYQPLNTSKNMWHSVTYSC